MLHMKFYCGAWREKTTPKIGTLLYGYLPDVKSESVHDDLTLSAIAFGNGNKTALLISADIGDLQTELCDDLRKAAADACDVDARDIIITSTHTHCAPNLSGVSGWGDIDRGYYESIFLPAALSASKKAVERMAEAELGVAVGQSEVGINRREHTRDGNILLGQNPWGLYDPVMTVIKIRRADTKAGIVNIVHYGCHGTACGLSTVITRDWPGAMVDRLEAETGTLSVFINGAIGDVGPRLTNGKTVGNIKYAEELGSYAAMDAVRIASQVKAYAPAGVSAYHGTVRLPYQAHPTLDEVRAQKAQIKDPESLVNINALRYRHLCDVEEILLAGDAAPRPEAFSFEQTIIAVGDILFVPFPFEIFSEISLRMRHYSGYAYTLSLSCANGYNGYLPSQDQLCRGGYEVGVFRYASPYSLADNTDDNIINENLKIIERGAQNV